jgi:drug/metabolite transporter (DMT)-like permease
MVSTVQHTAPLRGIALMLTSTLFMGLNNAVLKLLTAGFPVGQVMFMRAAAILPVIGLFAMMSGGMVSLRVRRWSAHSAHAIAMGLSAWFFILSVQHLPLATAVAITFATPLFVTAAAGPLLREEVGWRRWAAVMVGFLGILVITRPGSAVFQVAVIFPLICALGSAGRDIVTRRITAGETSVSIMATANCGMLLLGLCSLPWGWIMPDGRALLLVLLCAPLVAIGHWTTIEALRHAEANLAAPFRYSAIVWAAVLGFLIWDDVPDAWAMAGAGIVIASGVYILHREYLRRRAAPPAIAA